MQNLSHPTRREAVTLRARGRVGYTRPGEMNKLEADYATHLDLLTLAQYEPEDAVAKWYYESFKLRLAGKRTWYTPDFMVIRNEGQVELHEVKGSFVRDDAAVKLKVAASTYPEFRFVLATRPKRTWVCVVIEP